MFQPYPLFIAWRYLRARRRNRFASFVSLVSIAGIGLGVATLVIVLSVMNGFEREVTRHVLGMSAHASIVRPGAAMAPWPALLERLTRDPRLRAAAPFVRGSGMLSHRGHVTGVAVEGIDPAYEARVSDLGQYVERGVLDSLLPGARRVLIGDGLARSLQVAPGDEFTLVVPQWDASGGVLAPRYVRLTVAGLFHVGMYQFDARLVLMQLSDAAAVFDLGQQVSGLRLRFTDAAQAPRAARELAAALGAGFAAIDWTQYHRNFFLALASQKRIMFVILVLIVAVAAFNVAANMIMVVTEKVRDIAVLRTLGATRAQVVGLFLLQGLLVGAIGVALGVVAGAWGASESAAVAAWIEQLLGVDLINADVYFIDYLPAALRLDDVLLVAASTLLLALLATIYPALRAAGIQPAEAMHYE